MTKHTPLFFMLFLLAGTLCACGRWPADTPASPEAVLANAARETPLPLETPALTPSPEAVAYTLLVDEPDYTPAKYEPESGCYLGAHILADKSLDGNIAAFERLTGKRHALYVNEMVLGGEYPVSWVLSCIAARKTPCLIVQRPNLYEPFDYALLEQTAMDVGSLDIPMFVLLFPFSKAEKYDCEEYLAFYAEARRLLTEHAPQAALVWSTENVADAADYYPGDANVDWVGVGVTPCDDAAVVEAFVQAYQRRKPIMLTSLGISHYSTEDSAYDMAGAAARVAAVYSDIALRSPRVKAVLYRNENELERGLNAGEIQRDFTVTTEAILTAAYTAAIADTRFLSALETNNTTRGALMQGRYPAYAVGDAYFVAEASITEDIGAERLLPGTRPMSFDGETYRDLAFAHACVAFDFYVDAVKKWLVVRLL